MPKPVQTSRPCQFGPHRAIALARFGRAAECSIGSIACIGCIGKFIPKLIGLFQNGRCPFERLVKFYNFTEINRAIADSRRGSTVKPVLLMTQ